MNIDDEWSKFLNNNNEISICNNKEKIPDIIPTCGDINISTKTKILFFNIRIDLEDVFWKIPMISYDDFKNGVIKKQMKFNFTEKEQVVQFENNISKVKQPIDIKILTQIDNPKGRIMFKDVRKVSIGISKNDMIKFNKKSKSAFYNCYVIIYRIKEGDIFKEIHLKLFNSGKVEIPGIQNEETIEQSSRIIKELLQPYYTDKIEEVVEKRETILVNSNFNCNYYINREKLFRIMKKKNTIKCNFDSCSYPGIQCKYKLDEDRYVSFMIFRTGSILIVGKCENEELIIIYEFIKQILNENFRDIYECEYIEKPKKNKKKIKKIIYS